MPHNKVLMVLKSLIDFCFDGRECKYITVNNYGALWVKNKGCSCILTNSK